MQSSTSKCKIHSNEETEVRKQGDLITPVQKKKKSTVFFASPDNVRGLMDINSEDMLSTATKVMHPVKIKITKSAEAGIEEEADEEEDMEEIAGDGEEESDDEFGFTGISIRPEDVVSRRC